MAKTLFDFFEKNNIKITITNRPYSDAEAEVKSSAVATHGNYATIYYQENPMQGGKYLNILHELLHIATNQAMPFDAMGRTIEDENLQTYYNMFQRKLMEDAEWKDIQNFKFNPAQYNDKVSDRAKILAHATESAGEFVSSFVSNKDVQDVLSTITIGEVQTTTLWEEMRRWCKEMLAKIFHGNSFIMKEAVLDDITNFLLNTKFSATYDRPSLEEVSEEEYNKYLQKLEDTYNSAKDFRRPIQQPVPAQQQITPQTTQKQSGFDVSQAEFYSGAAMGSDTAWAKEARKLGIKVTDYTVGNYEALPQSEKAKYDAEYKEVAHTMGYNEAPENTYTGKLLRRDMMQADSADAIFAIGTINSRGYIEGGTGYATTRGIIRGIPVFVYDRRNKQWKIWDNNSKSFIVTSEPVLTPHAAVIGTRGEVVGKDNRGRNIYDIKEEEKQVIRNILAKIVGQQTQQPAQQQTVAIAPAKSVNEKTTGNQILEQFK